MAAIRLLTLLEFDAIVWTVFSLAFIVTALRIYTRAKLVRAFGWDDGLIIVGTLATFSMCFMGHYQAQALYIVFNESQTTGQLPQPTPETVGWWDRMFRYAFLTDAVYLLTLPIVKCSILAFYSRIAFHKKQHYLIYFVAFLIVGQGIGNLMGTIFAYDPPGAIWNVVTKPMGRRYNGENLQTFNSGFQVAFDVIILLMPIPILITTKLNKRTKAGLVFLYSLSFFSLASTIVRLVQALEFAADGNSLGAVTQRMTYTVWTVVEVTTAIICADLPALSSLLRHVHKGQTLPSHSSKSNNTGKSGSKSPFYMGRWFQNSFAKFYTSKGTSTSSQTELTEKSGSFSNPATSYADRHVANAYSDRKRPSFDKYGFADVNDESGVGMAPIAPRAQLANHPAAIYRTDEFTTEFESSKPVSSGR